MLSSSLSRTASRLLRSSPASRSQRPTVSSLSLPSSSSSFSPFRHICSSRPSFNNTIKVSVNGKDVDIPNGYTVLQACEASGVHVPRFCYHDRLSIAGNCRMCLVEIEKTPKPAASCAMPAMPGMKIKTDTPLVKKAREGVMEFLLANHPLDCPICDQGGECDLQDQSFDYGSDRSRFREYKRTVEDKNIGPLVKTVMTRCIHCTRCIRFTTEVAGVAIMGATGRGNAMEIGTYVDQVLDTELSGNVIDLCPVGALTSKPYAFTARPWELTRTESIDVMDAVGSNIRIDSRGPDVMRILPRLNEDINEEWIGDKSRFCYDGLKRQRIDSPLKKVNNEFVPTSWQEALTTIQQQVQSLTNPASELLGVIGDQADAESIIALKDLLNRFNSNNLITTQVRQALSSSLRSDYLFNSTITGIEDADAILFVNTNPRMEAAVISARIRKVLRNNDQLPVASIGPEFELNAPLKHLGNNTAILHQVATGNHPFSSTLKAAKKPLVIIGTAALNRADSAQILASVAELKKNVPSLVSGDWNGISILHASASRVAAHDLGAVSSISTAQLQSARFVYLLGADTNLDDLHLNGDAFVVYTGSHGDFGAERANLVLPAPAYTEKSGTYVNLEGRVQTTKPAVPRLQNARDDWAILRAISDTLGNPLPYNTIEAVRQRLIDVAPHFAENQEQIEKPSFTAASFTSASTSTPVSPSPFQPLFNNYFFTDPISRSSPSLAKSVQQLPNATNSYWSARPVKTQAAAAQPASSQPQQNTKHASATH